MRITTDIEGHRWIIHYILNSSEIDLEVDFTMDLSKVISKVTSDIRSEKIMSILC